MSQDELPIIMLASIENEINEQRQQLDAWLTDAYLDRPDAHKNGELAAGYPDWTSIETLVARIFEDRKRVRQPAGLG
jgi:hypothetical protein